MQRRAHVDRGKAKSKPLKISITGGLASLLIFFSGCGANHRDFYKENVELDGDMYGGRKTGALEYICVWIDLNQPPNELTKRLGVELSPAKITPLDDVDVNLLSSVAKPEPVPDMMSGKPLPDQARYSVQGYEIWVAKGKPTKIECGNNSIAPLWDVPRHAKYIMPLSEQDAAELFGPPERLEDSFQF